jgi:hypothetical protein
LGPLPRRRIIYEIFAISYVEKLEKEKLVIGCLGADFKHLKPPGKRLPRSAKMHLRQNTQLK